MQWYPGIHRSSHGLTHGTDANPFFGGLLGYRNTLVLVTESVTIGEQDNMIYHSRAIIPTDLFNPSRNP